MKRSHLSLADLYYLKRVMYISECNGRISELRSRGYVIETSVEKDAFGFAYYRLVSQPAGG